MKYWRGITLLETTLVIAIAAVICLASVHFYWQAKSQSVVLQATSLIERVVRASEEWKTAQRLPDLSSTTGNLVPDLIKAKLLPANDEANPWGGGVWVTGDSSGGMIIRLDGIPEDSCQLLVARFKTLATADGFRCYGKGGSETWEGQF